MPDTGAPWNIPYVAGTDLVADWPTDNQQQAQAIADALDDAWTIKQIVTATDTTDRTTTSATFVDASISITVTPKLAASDLYVIWTGRSRSVDTGGGSGGADLQITDASDVALEGAEAASFFTSNGANPLEASFVLIGKVAAVDTSSRTYKGRFLGQSVNNTNLDNATQTGRMMVIEV